MASLPMWFLHGFSPVLEFILYRILAYRKKVVEDNIRNSFPSFSETELKKAVKGFYKNLSQIFVESIKVFGLNEESIQKHFVLENASLLDPFYKEGRSVIIAAAHLSNWEIGAGIGKQFNHNCIMLMKDLKNPLISEEARLSRSKFGAGIVSNKHTAHVFETYHNKRSVFVLIADQSPKLSNQIHWNTFLNQETAWLTGAARYAKKYNLPLISANIYRESKGKYKVQLDLIADQSKDVSIEFLTDGYANNLERYILQNPSDYLWSHKRWKHKKD